LPLLELLGADRFMTVLTAVLCERRIVVMADEVGPLCSAVHAVAAMLYPFSWHHIFVPLLPEKLLSYATAPMPFIIGVQRYLKQQLFGAGPGEFLLIDADSGDCTLYGGLHVNSLAGEASSAGVVARDALKNAAGKAAGFLSSMMQTTTGSTFKARTEVRDKDAAVTLVSVLRHALGSKPGSGLLKIGNNDDGAKMAWGVTTNRAVRAGLLSFYVYLFGSVEGMHVGPGTGPTAASASVSASSSIKDTDGYHVKRHANMRAMGTENKALKEFVDLFQGSQMLERFCSERRERFQCAKTQQGCGASDPFFGVLAALVASASGSSATLSEIQSAVDQCSGESGRGGPGDSTDGDDVATGSDLHEMCVAVTRQSAKESDLYSALDTLAQETFEAGAVLRILKTLEVRLQQSQSARVRKATVVRGYLSLCHVFSLLC